MHEIDLAAPAGEPDYQFGGGLDMTGLDPTEAELAILLDAVGELSEQEWTDEIASLPDDELAGLEADAMLNEAESNTWMDAQTDEQFANLSNDASAYSSGDYVGYLHEVHRIDATLATQAEREHTRRAEDDGDAQRRGGSRHRRPTGEVTLANSLDRLARGTYLPGQLPVDLAGDDPFSTAPAATAQDVLAEMAYQLTGHGLPPARSRREPLPPVQALARSIGLR